MIIAIALSLGMIAGTGTSASNAATRPHSPTLTDPAWLMPTEEFPVDGNIGTSISRFVTLRRWQNRSWKKTATTRTDGHGTFRITLRTLEKKTKLRIGDIADANRTDPLHAAPP